MTLICFRYFITIAPQIRYKQIPECPGTLTVNDILGNRKELCQVKVDEAKETLGILLAPSESMEGEYNKLKDVTWDWVDKMQK
jgi:hypothetical protein